MIRNRLRIASSGIGLGPRSGTARRFAPRIETSLRACGARRQVPIRRCLFVNGGQGPPFHTFPPVTLAANEFAAGFFACSGRRHLLWGARRRVPIRRCLFVNGGQWPPFHTFPPVMRAANRVRCRSFGSLRASTSTVWRVAASSAFPLLPEDGRGTDWIVPVASGPRLSPRFRCLSPGLAVWTCGEWRWEFRPLRGRCRSEDRRSSLILTAQKIQRRSPQTVGDLDGWG